MSPRRLAKSSWTEEQARILLDSLERYAGSTAAVIADAEARTGRSRAAVIRKLVKIGHLKNTRDGPMSRSIKTGHRS
ncbi:hypothetical protein [Salinisphaera orenii]|uniref:hypothetical protein n=1 Tax=Salinisphaera orenii TaxID=856731 RepID=UPI0013A61B74